MAQPPPKQPPHAQARRRARRLALQALYQWQISQQSLRDIDAQFREEQDFSGADAEYFGELLHGVPARLDEVDAHIGAYVDRPQAELDPVERAILRIGAYELAFRMEVPFRVVVHEAVGLAKTFGAAESHKYVNSVLDRLGRKLRSAETGS